MAEPHYTLKDLVALDSRIDAHLDGLRIAGARGWDTAASYLDSGAAGELFAASVLAIDSQDRSRLDRVLEVASAKPSAGLGRGLVSALGWSYSEYVEPLIYALLRDDRSEVRAIGIRGCAIRRDQALLTLRDAPSSLHPAVQSALIRGFGEMGAVNKLPDCIDALRSADSDVRFWAAWSATLLGDHSAIGLLQESAEQPGRHSSRALQLAGRAMQLETALDWHRDLAHQPRSQRRAVQLAGVIGAPTLIGWLLDQMQGEDIARIAGESFSMITGIDLADEGLDTAQPSELATHPNEDPLDPDVTMDEDENLVWPNPAALSAWWEARQAQFHSHRRYLGGFDVTRLDLYSSARFMETATQRQRAAAALERKLVHSSEPLFEVRARGRLQLRATNSR